MDHVTLTTSRLGVVCHPQASTLLEYCTYCSFSRSRDIVGAHQNLNSSRDLTTPLSWMVCYPRVSTCFDQPAYTQFEVSISTHYEDMKGDTKCRKWGNKG